MSDVKEIKSSLNLINQKIDDIKADVVDLRITSAEQNKVLEGQHKSLLEHMHRSDLLERRIEQVSEQIKPIDFHVKFINRLAQVIIAVAAFAGTVAGILRLFQH